MVVVLPLLLLILLGSSPTGRAADDEHEEFTVLGMNSLKPHAACSGHRVIPPHNGSWVPLYRPLGPCSPSFTGAAKAKPPSLADLLRQDRLRVHHIHRRASGDFRASKGSYKEPVVVEETQVHHQAAISVGMGTQSLSSQMQGSHSPLRIGPAAADGTSAAPPAASQTVVLDTASDVPWVDCVPCALAECPYYDPARSSSYAAFPCNSSACKQLGPYANGCVNDQCQYRVVSPSDGSVTSSGTYSSDLLTIDSGNAVSNFKFGCNQNVQAGNQVTNGIMALGRGAQSLMAQTSSTYGDAFSYCIPQRESDKGFFRIGVPGGAAYRFIMTPMLRDRREQTLYRALMVAITVNGKPLNVPPEAFAAGTVLDSVTVITRLPLTVYGALRAAFRDKMAMYRPAPAQEHLDTCYNLTGVRYVRLPRIALVFDRNAVVELDRSGILLYNGDNAACLAFTSNNDDSAPAILGNTQQQTIEVLHDVGGGNIGFRRQAC